ncbi:MAG: hypothetical protein EAZ15_07280 [Sphingobacteriales bacterium]|nr:MAG: hypothetical protein EAZ15_07280 [Sphingobacteriales bacterium]
MQKFTAILLLFALLSFNFSRCFIYAGYNLNKKYITTSLCENRNKPLMHCNGKCFLMKKIKQANNKEKCNEAEFKKNNSYEALITTKLVITIPLVKNISLVFKNPTFTYPKKSNFIFEPPQA